MIRPGEYREGPFTIVRTGGNAWAVFLMRRDQDRLAVRNAIPRLTVARHWCKAQQQKDAP